VRGRVSFHRTSKSKYLRVEYATGGSLGRAAVLALTMLLVLGGPAPGAPADGEEDAGGRAGPESLWGPDERLTWNSSADEFPSLQVDWYGQAHLFWERGGLERMYLGLGENGSALAAERLIVKAPPTYLHSGQRTQNMGMDDFRGVHAVWTNSSFFGPTYQKFTTGGVALSAPIDVAPLASMPHTATISVGRNERAFIAYENADEDRMEMAVVFNSSGEYRLTTGSVAGKYGNGTAQGVDWYGNVHQFFKNATATGLWHSVFDSNGQLRLSARKVDTPVAGTGPDSAVPRLAFDSNGSIHMLQSSRVSGVKSLYYTRLAWDGTRQTDDILITSTSSGFGDLCVDEDLGVHIVYGGSNDGEIYYVKIVPGKVNGTLRPARLTNSAGASRDPVIVAPGGRALLAAWVDERDGQPEIYVKAGLRPGVDLSMSTDYTNQRTFLHLKRQFDFPATVRNLGRTNDTAMLNLSASFGGMEGGVGGEYDGAGWKVWLDEGTVPLGPLEEKNVTVHVRSPSSGRHGTYISVTLKAESGFENATWNQVKFSVGLSLTRGIELECPDNGREAMPDAPAVYNITVSAWDYREELNLSCSGPPGWQWLLNTSWVLLEPWESANLTLWVAPPPDASANSTGVVYVTAVSSGDPAVNDTVRVETRVGTVLEVSIAADRAAREVRPGEFARFTLTVEKRGNLDGETVVSLLIDPVNSGWTVSLERSLLRLRLLDPEEVGLLVAAPISAGAGDRLELDVLVVDADRRILSGCNVTVTAAWLRSLEIEAAEETVEVAPGGFAWLVVHAVNRGNGPETLLPGVPVLPAGWSAEYCLPNWSAVSPGLPAVVPPGSGLTLTLNVSAPDDAVAGFYTAAAPLVDGAGGEHPVNVRIEVLQVFSLSVVSETAESTVLPGGEARFGLAVRNRGNGPDRVSLDLGWLPRGWSDPQFVHEDGLSSKSLALAPFSLARVWVVVAVPPSYQGRSAALLLNASSPHGFFESLRLDLRVNHVNLGVTVASFSPERPRPGETVRIRYIVANTGDVNLERVEISVTEGGRRLLGRVLGRLDSGLSWVFYYEWTAVEGTHVLKFVVSHGNGTAEQDTEDNSTEVTLSVGVGKADGPAQGPAVAVAAAVALAAAAALAFLLKRRRRPGGAGRMKSS